MIEYLYDAIRAVAGNEIDITAYITDEFENFITQDCELVIHNGAGNEVLLRRNGIYDPDNMIWHFVLAPEDTAGMNGRYLYCIRHNNSNLCFKQPIYFK